MIDNDPVVRDRHFVRPGVYRVDGRDYRWSERGLGPRSEYSSVVLLGEHRCEVVAKWHHPMNRFLRLGLSAVWDGELVQFKRNGPRLRLVDRAIDVRGTSVSWVVRGSADEGVLVEVVADDGCRIARLSGRTVTVAPGLADRELCLVLFLALNQIPDTLLVRNLRI
ncbi:MAG: hypothetical protein U0P45_11930 [Acidimicrobiales bacterium]